MRKNYIYKVMKICYLNLIFFSFFFFFFCISEKAREKYFLALSSYGFSFSTDSVQLI